MSVVLPIHTAFDAMSIETAQKTALTTHGGQGEERVSDWPEMRIYTDCEEMEMIKAALETALKTALMQKPDKVLVRMAKIIQMILRNKKETVVSLAQVLGVSLRTLGVDMALLKTIHAVDRIGPDNGGEWVVLLDYGHSNVQRG